MSTTLDTTTPFPAGSIVVGVDGSPSAAEAVTWAAEQAALEHRPLTLVNAYHIDSIFWMETAGVDHHELQQELRQYGERLLDSAKRSALETAPGLEIYEVTYHADARTALLEASHAASMVVLGSRGRGRVTSLLLGSVGVAVVRHSSCPVVVRRPSRDGVHQGVVVGTDLSDDSRPALEYAFRLASTRHQRLTVLAFRPDFPWFGRNAGEDADGKDRERLTALLSDLGDKYPDVRVSEKDVEDPEARALVAAASDQDIIVVGSHHEGAVASALGQALAVAVVEHAPATVVVVPTAPVG
jgi:nucleotide-binding universal stress UspA family protein